MVTSFSLFGLDLKVPFQSGPPCTGQHSVGTMPGLIMVLSARTQECKWPAQLPNLEVVASSLSLELTP